MPASTQQKLKTRLMLGVPLTEIETDIDALSADELTELDDILAAFDKVKTRAADVNVDGVSVKADKARCLLIDRAWVLLGYNRSNAVRIGRA